MTPFGEKAIFVWNDSAIGSAETITQRLLDAKFEAAYLHSVNLSSWRTVSRVELAKSLKQAGIKVYAAAAIYGYSPAQEGQRAAQIVTEYGLDGFVFDAEATFDAQETPDSNAVHVLTNYKAMTDKPCAWCWWAYYKSPTTGGGWHPVNVLRAAMQYADAGMPMAYWWGSSADSAAAFVQNSIAQWRQVTDKPMVPAGRAYTGDDGTATPAGIAAFEAKARALGAVGVCWWSMEHAVKLSGVWDALTNLPGFANGDDNDGGTAMDWTKNAIGLYTKTAGWTNTAFNFIVGYAGGNWTEKSPGVYEMEPNPNLKPIELQARVKGKVFLALWEFDVDYYTRGQYMADEQHWPPESNDYPLQRMIDALKNRDFDGLIIRLMNRNNLDGNPELMSYVAFAAKKFIERANKWLYTTKGLNKWTFVLTNDTFLRLDGKQENFYSWLKDWWLGIEQEATRPLASGAWPQETDKIKAIPPSLGWKLWYHYNAANLDMMIWNGTIEDMRDFLGVGDTTDPEPPVDPEPPTGDYVARAEFDELAAKVAAIETKLAAAKAAL